MVRKTHPTDVSEGIVRVGCIPCTISVLEQTVRLFAMPYSLLPFYLRGIQTNKYGREARLHL